MLTPKDIEIIRMIVVQELGKSGLSNVAVATTAGEVPAGIPGTIRITLGQPAYATPAQQNIAVPYLLNNEDLSRMTEEANKEKMYPASFIAWLHGMKDGNGYTERMYQRWLKEKGADHGL